MMLVFVKCFDIIFDFKKQPIEPDAVISTQSMADIAEVWRLLLLDVF